MRTIGILVYLIVAVTITTPSLAFPGKHSQQCGLAEGLAFLAAEGTPDKYKRFLGVFDGKWNRELEHTLIIYHIDAAGDAKGYYSVPNYSAWNVKASCEPVDAKIDGDVLLVKLENSNKARYTISGNDVLSGEYIYSGGITPGVFKRANGITVSDVDSSEGFANFVEFPDGYSYYRFESKLVEDDKPVRLHMVVHQPQGDGPFPMFVFNHGSTGWGKYPSKFQKVDPFMPVAQLFVSRGWMVAIPYRRGRGWSDGLYDEGFQTPRSRGYSCDDIVTTKGFKRALTDVDASMELLTENFDIDESRIVIGGVSRGGILSVGFAGQYPERVRGVVNIVGGWLGEGCRTASRVNRKLASTGSKFEHPMVWIYGGKDDYYSLKHTKGVFGEFQNHGGQGEFVTFDNYGHDLIWNMSDWKQTVRDYMISLGFTEFE